MRLLLFLMITLIASCHRQGSISVLPPCYDLQGQSWDICTTEAPLFVVFFNNYSCLQCFNEILGLYKQVVTGNAKVIPIVLARVGAEAKSKAVRRPVIQQYLPEFTVYYDYQTGPDPYPPVNITEGIYGALQIDKTPSLLLLQADNCQGRMLYRYEQLFDSSGKLKTGLREAVMEFYSNTLSK